MDPPKKLLADSLYELTISRVEEIRTNLADKIYIDVLDLLSSRAYDGKSAVIIHLRRNARVGHPMMKPDVDVELWKCGDYDDDTIKLLVHKITLEGFKCTVCNVRRGTNDSSADPDIALNVNWGKTSTRSCACM